MRVPNSWNMRIGRLLGHATQQLVAATSLQIHNGFHTNRVPRIFGNSKLLGVKAPVKNDLPKDTLSQTARETFVVSGWLHTALLSLICETFVRLSCRGKHTDLCSRLIEAQLPD